MSRENVPPGHADFGAYERLIRDVFGFAVAPAWDAICLLDGAKRCVAGLQHTVLGLRAAGALLPCVAIRNVAVAEDWRGRGLMHELFARLLARSGAGADLSLLYTETPALYARHGFVPLPQHAFEGVAPPPVGPATARRLDLSRDEALVGRLLSTRAALSDQVFMAQDSGLTAHALRRTRTALFYDATLNAVLLAEDDDGTLVLGDVIAPVMPTAARLLGALALRPGRLRTLFPPDRLGWMGDPLLDDAGLMVRGPVPEALRRPFMLPPTVEF